MVDYKWFLQKNTEDAKFQYLLFVKFSDEPLLANEKQQHALE